MSIIGMPSFAMLLVLTNIALCLCVDRDRPASDLRQPTTMASSPAQQGAAPDAKPSIEAASAALTATVPLRTDWPAAD